MNRSVLYTLCAVLTIAAIILVGCQKSAVTGNTVVDTNVPTETPASPEETDVLSEEQTVEEFPSEEITDTKSSNEPTYDGDVKVFTIKANNMRFEPYTMTVKKGDKVRMVVTAEDRTYNFQLAEFHVKGVVEQGQTITVDFTATMSDKFAIFSRREWNGGKLDRLGELVVEIQ